MSNARDAGSETPDEALEIREAGRAVVGETAGVPYDVDRAVAGHRTLDFVEIIRIAVGGRGLHSGRHSARDRLRHEVQSASDVAGVLRPAAEPSLESLVTIAEHPAAMLGGGDGRVFERGRRHLSSVPVLPFA
jgi:hypothetical protein